MPLLRSLLIWCRRALRLQPLPAPSPLLETRVTPREAMRLHLLATMAERAVPEVRDALLSEATEMVERAAHRAKPTPAKTLERGSVVELHGLPYRVREIRRRRVVLEAC